ncbi:hypothetical protein Clacol_006007 [Clathrus columnatus]|uniref:Uncharacterized protein n=1 Tax=Clathrus columnatus TaxID=1419009 RepID=A0AAV5AGF8_9AGAM|nr:hypothetical protein Clacol_006007 [Clathrus columnatus]
MLYELSTVKIFEIGKDVAIKIVRAQENMNRAGLKGVQMLNKVSQAHPGDEKPAACLGAYLRTSRPSMHRV